MSGDVLSMLSATKARRHKFLYFNLCAYVSLWQIVCFEKSFLKSRAGESDPFQLKPEAAEGERRSTEKERPSVERA
jgi:hypothetical protein